PGEFISLGRYLQNWSTAVRDNGGLPRVGVVSLALAMLAIAMGMLWFWWQRRGAVAAGAPGRFSKVFSSFGVFLCLALATPLVTMTLLEATEVRMIEISCGVHLLLSHRHSGGTGETPLLARWLRVLGWLILGAIAITLISGYPTFAAF